MDENLGGPSLLDYASTKRVQTDAQTVQNNNDANDKIAHIFSVIQANLSSELVNKTGAIFQFHVKGMLLYRINRCFCWMAFLNRFM